MTNQARGSSLLQARKPHLFRHSHNTNGHHRERRRIHSHEEIHRRQAVDLESAVTEVVQTVSVIQLIGSNGETLGLSTLSSPPPAVTLPADQTSALATEPASQEIPLPSFPTIEPPVEPPVVLPTPPVEPPPVDVPTPPVVVPPPVDLPTLPVEVPTVVLPTAILPTVPLEVPPIVLPTSSLAAILPSRAVTPLTSAPSAGSSAFPSLSRGFNSSSTSTGPLFNNSTVLHSLFANTTRSSTASTAYLKSNSTTLIPSTSTEVAVVTVFDGNNGAGGADSTAAGGPVPSSTPSDSPGGTILGTPTTTFVGGLVGSIAGLAILIAVALFVLRWKRQQRNGLLLGEGDGLNGSRTLPAPRGGGSRNSMADRGLQFVVPSALAALAGNKRKSQANAAGTETNEKGFYRISGRKLPSVLQHGGDGFRDPRLSAVSGTTDIRDSQVFWDGPASPQFAVGSPMRPESGVMIMHPGPGRTPVRTPVTEQGPYFDNINLELSPPSALGQIGRSQSSLSQNSSRGSGSRFTEDI